MNAVGACTPAHRELDTAAVLRARVIVDTMAACLKEPGELIRFRNDSHHPLTPVTHPSPTVTHTPGDLVAPITAGEIEVSHLKGELGSVLSGQLEGRTSDDEVR